MFAAPMHEQFPIDASHAEGLPHYVTRGIRRYGLRFTVCRVPHTETPFAEPDWEGYAFFRFRASKYLDIVSYSANNPDIV